MYISTPYCSIIRSSQSRVREEEIDGMGMVHGVILLGVGGLRTGLAGGRQPANIALWRS